MGSRSSSVTNYLCSLPLKLQAGDPNEAVFRGVNPLLSQIASSLTKAQLKDSAPVSAHWHLCWLAVGAAAFWLH